MVFLIFGLGGLVVQGIFLRLLNMIATDKWLLVVGLQAYVAMNLLFGMASSKWNAYAALMVGSVGSIVFPAIASIKSANASPSEQGLL